MNNGQKVLAVLLGSVVAELAVLDYAAWRMLHDGVTVDVSYEELQQAGEAALEDMEEE